MKEERDLPKGVRLYKGKYVQVRILHKGQIHEAYFGADSPLARQQAALHANQVYLQIKMGTFNPVKAKDPSVMLFEKARVVFHTRHFLDYRDPATHQPRTAGAIRSAYDLLRTLGKYFDKYPLNEIDVLLIKAYRTKRLDVDKVSNATFNKERGLLQSLYKQFRVWITEGSLRPVKLPQDKDGNFINPADSTFIPHLTENKRERVPDTWELAAAYTWCKTQDQGLWDAIEHALLTALRKQDLIGLDGSLTVKGIQQKTGEKFDLPLTLEKPADFTNWKRRWNALRKAMGWLLGGAKHTTWHDLRHWAPTMLGEKGFSTKIIQHYTGHKKEETAERYTNVRRKALEPAVQTIKDAIEQFKEQAK